MQSYIFICNLRYSKIMKFTLDVWRKNTKIGVLCRRIGRCNFAAGK